MFPVLSLDRVAKLYQPKRVVISLSLTRNLENSKKRGGGIQPTKKECYVRFRIPLKHGTRRVRWQGRWKGCCWGTTRAVTRRRTAKVDQKTKCNCVRFLICAFVNNVNKFAEKEINKTFVFLGKFNIFKSMHACRMRTVTYLTSDFSRLRDIIFRISCFMTLRNIAIDSIVSRRFKAVSRYCNFQRKLILFLIRFSSITK